MSELGANSGNDNDLLVDFGHRHPRRTSNTTGDGGGEESATNTRRVSFSEDITVRYFQYPSRDEVSTRWHSQRDRNVFQQELARDVRSLRLLLSVTPMEDLEKEALYDCIGLEALVSSNVARVVREMRQGHARSIVEMQDYLSEEELAACAMSLSSQSRERAQRLADCYSEVLP